MKKTVMVGMSGGVDSSVAALLLKEQGFNVVGLFMKNWDETDESGVCTAENDYSDVRRVADKIGIPYYTVNFTKQYWEGVFSTFVSEYSRGRTPNPDVLCNREIKFGVFREYAKKLGADFIATGHYCGTLHENGRTYLTRAADENKCQTYFLNQVTEKQIEDVIFPLADMQKKEVREIAANFGLATAEKKDSTGVCFIGERNFRKFLSKYLPMKEGKIMTLDGQIVGTHSGVYYYTAGQHKGFGLGGAKGFENNEAWYVIKKDVEKNILYVSQGEHESLYSMSARTDGFNFITEKMKEGEVKARLRHRQELFDVNFYSDGDGITVEFKNPQRAVAAGQYLVLYKDNICLGGGVIT